MEHLRSEPLPTRQGTLTALDRLARVEARYPDELFVLLRTSGSD
jgi:hypothetical protein